MARPSCILFHQALVSPGRTQNRLAQGRERNRFRRLRFEPNDSTICIRLIIKSLLLTWLNRNIQSFQCMQYQCKLPPAKLKTESCSLPFDLESPLKPELEFMTLLNSKILLGFNRLGWAYFARSGSQTKHTGIRLIYSPAIPNLFT